MLISCEQMIYYVNVADGEAYQVDVKELIDAYNSKFCPDFVFYETKYNNVVERMEDNEWYLCKYCKRFYSIDMLNEKNICELCDK